MSEQEQEIQKLKERIAYLEGVIEGMKTKPVWPTAPSGPFYVPTQPFYTVTC